jgi:hypothetical protein
MPAAAERAAGRGQPGRRQEAGRAAEAARARACAGLEPVEKVVTQSALWGLKSFVQAGSSTP